jgi:hypothetical protein
MKEYNKNIGEQTFDKIDGGIYNMVIGNVEFDRLEEFLERTEGRFTSTSVLYKDLEVAHIDILDTAFCKDSDVFRLEDAQMETSNAITIHRKDIAGVKDYVDYIKVYVGDLIYIITII